MAVIQGVKERVHAPIYDSISVAPKDQLKSVEPRSIIKFFSNVQNKTKLQTNLQSASLLPHYNTFEARALRVVMSDLPPRFPNDVLAEVKESCPVETDDDLQMKTDASGAIEVATQPGEFDGEANLVSADVELGLGEIVRLLREAREKDEGWVSIPTYHPAVTIQPDNADPDEVDSLFGSVYLDVDDLEALLEEIPTEDMPPLEQREFNHGSGNIVSKIIYNTVTTLFVGEKIMIQMPTWFFPGGAGAYSDTQDALSHGEPSPMATFRFAEPIFIDKQQNFRVEIEVPDSQVQKQIQNLYGPFHMWVVLDGYMTRDVQ